MLHPDGRGLRADAAGLSREHAGLRSSWAFEHAGEAEDPKSRRAWSWLIVLVRHTEEKQRGGVVIKFPQETTRDNLRDAEDEEEKDEEEKDEDEDTDAVSSDEDEENEFEDAEDSGSDYI
ncbi:hypothetical protein evm_010732 [Chilo suppressalis]|nr:hypothetical protein evm_010732 [Chilo suppressalis]